MEDDYRKAIMNAKMKDQLAQFVVSNPVQAKIMSGITGDLSLSVREIVHRLASVKAMRDEYVSLGFTVPKPMDEEINTLMRQAKSRYREDLDSQLAAAKKKADELKSKEKQREEAEAEIARLTAELEGK